MNYLNVKNNVLRLYLIGLKGIFEINTKKSYFFYKKLLFLGSSLFFVKWFLFQLKFEFDKRSQPNFLIPRFIYKSRKESYIYWEISRIANKLPTTFSYFYFKEGFIFYFDKFGNLKTEKNLIEREKIEQIENPYFEEIIKQINNNKKNEKLRNKGNKLIAYNKFLLDRYDLDNYLHWKSITISDIIRATYFKIMKTLKFTNHYRYDHILFKSEFSYEYEKLKYIFNLNDKIPEKRLYKLKKITNLYDNNYNDIKNSFYNMITYYFN